MTPGEVFFWPSHEFDDGGKSNKLLIVLNAQRNGYHLAAYTTSTEGRWLIKEGCNRRGEVFCCLKNTHGFTRHTWIQLWRVREYEADYLERMVERGRIRSLRQLHSQLIRAIVNCYRETDSFTDYHGWLLEDS